MKLFFARIRLSLFLLLNFKKGYLKYTKSKEGRILHIAAASGSFLDGDFAIVKSFYQAEVK